ncbi:hypothetical protein [Thomasclavelia sp.]|uniref:plasmid mobilization protein n=1 Tax=Thomasclavelia sp. TaxID=3025757 RepID=UPI0025E34AC2|nr:hypothetical protein [Thomasclavelia sp.]
MPFYGYGERNGRKRKNCVCFRVSDEEFEWLDELISLTEMNKQEYFISKLLDKSIIVYGNPKTYKNLKKLINKYCDTLNQYIECGIKMDWYQTTMLLHIAEILKGLSEDTDVKSEVTE